MAIVETPETPPPGRGRRRRLEEPADQRLCLRLTASEAAALAAVAAARGCSTSQLVRASLARDFGDVVVTPPPPVRVSDPVATELGRVGGLLKQLLNAQPGPVEAAALRGVLASALAAIRQVRQRQAAV